MTTSESPVWFSTSKGQSGCPVCHLAGLMPHCPSSSPSYSVCLGCSPCHYVLGRASPETCSIGFVPVSGQTSASSMSSLGSPFSAGNLTSPVPPEVEARRKEGTKRESHMRLLRVGRQGGKGTQRGSHMRLLNTTQDKMV